MGLDRNIQQALHFFDISSILQLMAILKERLQSDPLKILDQFEKMMKLVEQFPIKEINVRLFSTTGR